MKRARKKKIIKKRTTRSKKSLRTSCARTQKPHGKKTNTPKTKQSFIQHITNENIRLVSHISELVQKDRASLSALDELSSSYNQTRLVLMVRDPYWVYAYWDISKEKEKEIKLFRQRCKGPVTSVLRVYDITHEEPQREKPINYFDIEVPFDIGQWYIYLGKPDHKFTADIGLIHENNNFYLVTWSNPVTMPRCEPSNMIDSQWSDVHSIFNEMYPLNHPSSYHTHPIMRSMSHEHST